MTSLPPQQSARRVYQNQEESASPPQRTDNIALSTTSVDSQTVFLNDPPDQTSDGVTAQDTTTKNQTAEGEEPSKCWICFADETEDTPDSSPWRSPCPCALTAHESCLLDWVADMEAPQGSRATGSQVVDLKCPQCKSPIRLARPKSGVIDMVSAFEKLAGRLLWPTVITGLSYCVVTGSAHHGAHTVRMIFGTEDANAILAPGQLTWPEQAVINTIPESIRAYFTTWRGWRLELGLPLIPLTLVASRTHLADAVLPILPIVFFAMHPNNSGSIQDPYWPPSASLTLVVLPYLRSIYDEYLEQVWGDRERAWLKEILPRAGETDQAAHAHEHHHDHHNHDHDHEHEDIVEIDIGIELDADIFGGADEAEEDEEIAEGIAPALNAPPEDDEEDQHENAQNEPARQNAPAQRQRLIHGDLDLFTAGTRVAETLLGALFFPAISAVVGETMRAILPTSWTVPQAVSSKNGRQVIPTGLLQTRWGRSIIGGALFVVLKDAIRIYCRWKLAKAHRERRVLNYDKQKKRIIE